MKVRSDITGDIAFPVDQQLRPLAGIGGEEPGQPARDGITPALPQLAFFTGLEVAEVGGQRLAPALFAAGIDDLEQRPHHRIGGPRIVVRRARDFGDEGVRIAERDAGADAVLAVTAAEDVAEPLTQPALDALGGNDDQLFGEGVRQGIGQQRTEAIGEEVGAFSAVEVQAHRSPP